MFSDLLGLSKIKEVFFIIAYNQFVFLLNQDTKLFMNFEL